MKFRVERDALADAVAWTAKALPSRPSVPVLAGVMLRVWSPLYDGLAAAGIVDFSFETAYAGIAWLCWVPNLLLAIWFTRHRIDVTTAA